MSSHRKNGLHVHLSLVVLALTMFLPACDPKPIGTAVTNVLVKIGKSFSKTMVYNGMRSLFSMFDSFRGQATAETAKADAEHVDIDPANPLRGKMRGPLEVSDSANPGKKITLTNFHVFRENANTDRWYPADSVQTQIDQAIK